MKLMNTQLARSPCKLKQFSVKQLHSSLLQALKSTSCCWLVLLLAKLIIAADKLEVLSLWYSVN